MDINAIGSFISQYGFPIVACCALFWQNNNQDKRHQEESKNWTDAMTANTLAITELKDAINRGFKDV